MSNKYKNTLGYKHQLIRFLWCICWGVFASWIPRSMAGGWKRFLLRLFGANVASTALVYSSARIYYPPNLIMEEHSCLDANVNCYNVAPVYIGSYVTVSQATMICTASHDISSPSHSLIISPIHIRSHVWIGAGAFIGMGVEIGEGAVIGARAAVFKSVNPWVVVGGNPARFIKNRVINYG